MVNTFIHLHTHSYYSFLRGIPSPEALVEAAVLDGMPAIALTDHVTLTGAVEFYQVCLEKGIHPVIGLEIPVTLPAEITSKPETMIPDIGGVSADSSVLVPDELVFLAMDLEGWRSICRLSSAVGGNQLTDPEGGVIFEQLVNETTGLICLCGGKRGLISKLLQAGFNEVVEEYVSQLSEIFHDRFYIMLEDHEPGDHIMVARLVNLADNLSIPTVATQDVHYIEPGDQRLQRLVSAIRLNQQMMALPENAVAPRHSHFTTQAEMIKRFANYPGALETTQEITERCQLVLPLGETYFPELDLPTGQTAMDVLRRKAYQGAIKRYGGISPKVSERLAHELEVIENSGYATIFLVMEEIIQFARASSIPVSSRGSAASSLVAHCLGITDPDPLELNLYFERFLNPARSSPPDIDTDLCSKRRDEVIDFVYRRFGQEKVAMVCTINRFRRRSALREVAKAHGLKPSEIKSLVDQLPRRGWGPPDRNTQQKNPFTELGEHFSSPKYGGIFSDAEAILGTPRHLSIHPGGMVIAPDAINDLVPTQLATKGVVITQFDLGAIEQMGLVKIDLLGIRGLTVLNDVGQAIYRLVNEAETKDSKVDLPASMQVTSSPLDVLDAVPDQDEATAEVVRNGRTIGCFQIESPGMRATLREIQATSRDDIMVALALYRPGPLTGGLKDAFVQRHLGLAEVKHLDPALEPLLKDTYGVILYQEQVLRVANELAGLSLADADLLRRAMSHFDPGEQMVTLKEKFILGAYQRSGVPEEVGERVWALMAAFAGYGFPKAHAASYAQVAWRSAWCKTHFPAVFMAAVLANWGGYYRQSVYLTEARRSGLVVRPPHINFAQQEFSLSYVNTEPVLFMGLDQVRELTKRTQGRIIRYRPFQSISDFLTRVDPRPVEVENLVKVGALDGMGPIPRLLDQLKTTKWQRGQLPLFEMDSMVVGAPKMDANLDEDWSLADRVAAQVEILGASLDAHPLELASEAIDRAGAMTTVEAIERVGSRVQVAGMRQTWRRGSTSQGERIYVMSLEDLEGMLNVVISMDVYRRVKRELSGAGPYLVTGEVALDQRTGEPYLRADRINRL